MKTAIEIRNLSVDYRISADESVHALRDVSLVISEGMSVAVVGESGCGKSTLANAVLNLMPQNASAKGSVRINGLEALNKKNKELEKIRGVKAGIIFQEPGASLNPVMTIREQIAETILAHAPRTDKTALKQKVVKLLAEAGIKDAERVCGSYPHQLSGGQQQRVMIAIALSCGPGILIADEPTTALDVTVQAQIVTLLKKLKKDRGLTLFLITHDLHLALSIAERVIVMYAGEIVEDGKIRGEKNSRHPYTRALFEIIPDLKARKKDFKVIPGSLPDMRAYEDRCYFADRCRRVKDKCRHRHPEMEKGVRCYYPYGISRQKSKVKTQK